ncbi:hypothetical protein PI95_034120 [Hassallia byssoidea VB512170]|uniref:Uncharacterized protein n=1 Tax=Hassallia byssoidea VB512170 TaxID=1304833 RepID=A0A846HKT8_9CYAN|nr:hypothetical protein [Hassalia byssoidea]NEU77373.1 hypothetical protein [Hassalia byssoidea VB512170]
MLNRWFHFPQVFTFSVQAIASHHTNRAIALLFDHKCDRPSGTGGRCDRL